MTKKKILIQLDPDPNASTFDSIVAIDSGVDHVLVQTDVSPIEVEPLVHGAMFTRGPDDLKSTALFFGGSDVKLCESLVRAAKHVFFGPMRVSMMSDPNGSNTTAAAAVLSAEAHLDLKGKTVVVLAATGPVGQRIAQLVVHRGASARLCSRNLERAEQVCEQVRENSPDAELTPMVTENDEEKLAAVAGSDVLFAAGAAGVNLLGPKWLTMDVKPAVAVDINAVPPEGIHGVNVMDKGNAEDGVIKYGAIGVGGLKMKIHKRCIQALFEANDRVLEIKEIYEIGSRLGS